MIKPTSILLTTLMSGAEAIKVSKHNDMDEIPQEILEADRAEALAQMEWENHLLIDGGVKSTGMSEAVDPVMMLKAQAGKYTPKDCYAGIERYTDGPSNSQSTYDVANKAIKAMGRGLKWNDFEFGADDTSLNWKQFGYGVYDDVTSKEIFWQRPSQIDNESGEKPSLWGDFGKPIPNGVNQGGLGDCWFLAAASALAEKPERIHRVIHDNEYNDQGIFRFYFFLRNGWYGVNVDDRLPTVRSGNGFQTIFTHKSQNNAWWMPLLEKAYAKLGTNYDRLNAGFVHEGLRYLTGMPTTGIAHFPGKQDEYRPRIRRFAELHYPMVAGCCFGGQPLKGLINGHAYSVLDVKDLHNADGSVAHTLVQIRNPWSSEHYTGKWNDNDASWTEEWKKEVNLKPANDGKFWMPYDEYLTLFWGTGVAIYEPFKHFEIYENKVGEYSQWIALVDNPVDQELFITVQHRTPRQLTWNKCRRDGLTVNMYDKDWNKVGGGVSSCTPSLGWSTVGNFDGKVPKGKYKLYIYNIQAKDQWEVDFSASVYSMDEKVGFVWKPQ